MKPIKRYILVETIESDLLASGIILPPALRHKYSKAIVKAIPDSDVYIYPPVGSRVIYSNQYFKEQSDEGAWLDVLSVVAYEVGDDMFIPETYVAVKKIRDDDKIKTASGVELWVDTSYQEEYHAHTTGEVVILPQSLPFVSLSKAQTFGQSYMQYAAQKGMPWQTEVELKVGDKVNFHYLALSNAEKQGFGFDYKGEKIFLIRYDQIYAYERDNEVCPINGFVFVEVEELPQQFQTGAGVWAVSLTEASRRKKFGVGVVRYAGKPNTAYFEPKFDDGEELLHAGDKVHYKDSKRSKVGQDMYSHDSPFKGLYRMQYKDINAILT